MVIVSGGVQLTLVRKAHEDAPVVECQARLARLRRARIVSGLALGLPWWIVWVTIAMVISLKAGVDLYVHSPAWVWWNLGIGAVGMGVCWWLAHRFAGKSPQSQPMRAVVDSLTGRNLRQVAQQPRGDRSVHRRMSGAARDQAPAADEGRDSDACR